MTLEEAMQLASVVENSGSWTVVAIGRFEMLADLSKACMGGFAHKLPWQISVMQVDDCKTIAKLSCSDDWQSLVAERVSVSKPVVVSQLAEPSVADGMLF